MEPIDFLGALRRSWRLLLVLAVLGAVIAVFLPVGHKHKVKVALPYSATAIVGAAPNAEGTLLNGGVSSGQIQFFATTVAAQQTVANAAGLDVPAFEFPQYMTASIVAAGSVAGYFGSAATATLRKTSPTLVELTGYGKTASDAVSLANEYASQLDYIILNYANQRAQADPKTANLTVTTGYTVHSYAEYATKITSKASASPVASRKIRLLGGFVIGALLAAGIVLLRELLDKRIRNAARAEANFGFPVVVEIPVATLGPAVSAAVPVPAVDVIRDPDSAGAEAYRMLRMSVMFEPLAPLSGPVDPYALGLEAGPGSLPAGNDAPGAGLAETIGRRQVILVVSAAAEPTRPHVAANLAAVYAEAGQRVVVISTGDIEAGLVGGGGAVTGDITPEDIRSRLEPSRLEHVSRLHLNHFMTNSGQLVSRVPQVLDATRTLADAIIVEVPPLLAVHHAEALAHAVDVVLVVGECRFTTFTDARRAGDLLRRLAAPVLGVVLTNVRLDPRDIRQVAFVRQDAAADATDTREPVVALSAGGPPGPST
jgi:Mrp family chromosome partitioning ATPase